MPDLTLSADMDALLASANDAAARTELGLTALATTTPGTGVATALAVNIGSAGAPVLFNGAGGTPSSIVLTNATGTAAGLTAGTASAVAVGGITGLGTNVATALAINVGSAGAFIRFNGDAGTPSALIGTNITGTAAGLTAGAVTNGVTAAAAAAGAGLFWTSGGADKTAVATDTITTINATNANVTNLLPVANDGAAIGASGTAFSDLFLASGAVINFNAGDVTLTHASNLLTLAGGELILPTDGPTSTLSAGFRGVPQNSQSAAYTTVLADAGRHILHPTADNNARTFTIDSNANVAYPIGTSITFINQINTVTIAITADTLVLAGAGTTGSRTLAANGIATAVKIASTTWMINGTGLT